MINTRYQAIWNDLDLQARIENGIRQYRQSPGTIRVTGYDGTPRPGVKIRVKQHDAAFHFGANIFMLEGYDSAELNRGYEDAFCGIFNAASVPFYWRTLEPEPGRPRYGGHSVPISRRPPPDAVVAFCERQGLRMHGHTLVWSFRKWSSPDWLPEDPALSGPLYENRFQEISERYGHKIKRWDVLNEAVSAAAALARDTPGHRHGIHHPMQEDYELHSFAWAEKYFPPDSRFDINETTRAWYLKDPGYTQLIQRLLTAKAKLGGIGLQFHLFQDEELEHTARGELFHPYQLQEALDHYGKFGLPLHVSEITLTSPGNTPGGLEAQAEVARNFYRLWFSHPAVEGITWWNLPDGGAAPGEDKVHSGLLFADLSPKPSYEVLRRLIREEWRTETEGHTDGDGRFQYRGFHGTYRVITESGMESSITLEPGKSAELLIRC